MKLKFIDINIVRNAFWMISEKMVSILGVIFITAYMAKYIGPESFGKITFATAIFAITQTLALLGSDTVLFKRISRNPGSGTALMFSTNRLRQGCFVLLSAAILIYTGLREDFITFYFCAATFVASFFSLRDVFTIYHDARLESRFNTLANVAGLGSALLVRYLIVYLDLHLYFLAIPIVMVYLIPYLIRHHIYHRRYPRFVAPKRVRRKYVRYLLASGLPLAVSNVSIAIYTRLAQLFLMWFVSAQALGIYSVAITLATAWMFVTDAVITSFFAKIFAYHRDDAMRTAAKLNGLVLAIAAAIVAGIVLLGKPVIVLLYGEQYLAAYPAMGVLAVSTLLSALGTVAYKYIVLFSGYGFLSKKMFLVFIINIPLSYFLIRQYGMMGAAYSTLLTELLSLTLLNYFFRRGAVLQMHLRSLNPWTYIRRTQHAS